MSLRRKSLLLSSSFLAVLTATALGGGASYTVTEIPAIDGGSVNPVAISNSGTVLVQFVANSGNDQGATWNSNESTQILSGDGYDWISPQAINNEGKVVGWALSGTPNAPTGNPVAANWQGGQFNSLPPLTPDGVAGAFGINDNNVIVGSSTSPASSSRAVRWTNGIPEDLSADLPSGISSAIAQAINNNGQVIINAGANGEAFVLSGNQILQLTVTDPTASVDAIAINKSGQVAGTIRHGDGTSQAFIWTNGQMQMTPVGSLADNSSYQPSSLSDSGVEVGYFLSLSTGQISAYTWDGSNPPVDLNSLIDPTTGWQLENAISINSEGQIVGTGLYNGQPDAFLLTPTGTNPNTATPEPATASLLLLGTTLLLRKNRRVPAM